MVVHSQNYLYHWILRSMTFQTHITTWRIVTFEKITYLECCDVLDGIRAFWLQTAQLEAPGNGMMRSGSNNSTPIAHNCDSPWMMLVWTVEIYHSLCSNNQKQLMRMMKGDWCNKKFEVWSKIEEDWWVWRFWSSWDFERMWKVWDLIFGEMIFCYD